jgi:hypothetical protein
MDAQDPRAAASQDPRRVRLTQVVTRNSRSSTVWEFLMTGRSEQVTTTYTVVPMLR